jgi:hypothetical protein
MRKNLAQEFAQSWTGRIRAHRQACCRIVLIQALTPGYDPANCKPSEWQDLIGTSQTSPPTSHRQN